MWDINLSKNQRIFAFAIIFVAAIVLRTLSYASITVGYDQARDAMEAVKIIVSDPIKLQGPMTDIRGLYHGAFYWYLLAPVYYFTNYNVFVAKALMIMINLICLPIFYALSRRMWRNELVSLISCLLFAFSFEATQYARWLSNPSPAVLTTLITWCGFYLMTTRNYKGIILFLLSWPFSVNFEFFLAYHVAIFLPLLVIYFKPADLLRHKLKLLLGAIGCIIGFAPFILAQIKYKFVAVTSLLEHLSKSKSGKPVFSTSIAEFVKIIQNEIVYTTIHIDYYVPTVILILFVAGVFFVPRSIRKMYVFTLLWFFSVYIVFSFGSLHAHFLTLGSIYASIMLFSVTVVVLFSKIRDIRVRSGIFAIFMVLVIIINFDFIYSRSSQGEIIFSVQSNNTLGHALDAVDYTYESSGGKPFAINTVTNPLFINTKWAFFYAWHGRGKYGYMPAWRGADQVGSFGSEVEYARMASQAGNLLYLIYEQEAGISKFYYLAYPKYEDRRSRLLETKHFGSYRVEKRLMTNENGFFIDHLIDEVSSKPIIDAVTTYVDLEQ